MGDYKYRPPFHQIVHAALHDGFGTRVDGRGCLVQYHNRWIGNCRTCNGNQLALALRQSAAVTLKHGVIFFRQHAYKAVGIYQFGCLYAFFIRCIQSAVSNVVHYASCKQIDILQYHSQGTAQIFFSNFVDIDSVVLNLAVVYVIKSVNQIRNGRLAGSGRTHKCHLLTRLGIHRYIMQNHDILFISEVHIFQIDFAAHSYQLAAVFPCPYSCMLPAFRQISFCIFACVYQSHGAAVFFRRHIEEFKDSRCSCKCHYHRIELLGNLCNRIDKAL